jgi:hypothetical protein
LVSDLLLFVGHPRARLFARQPCRCFGATPWYCATRLLYHLFLLCAAPRRLAPARAAAAMLALRAVVREAERVHRRGAGDASLKASCLSELL